MTQRSLIALKSGRVQLKSLTRKQLYQRVWSMPLAALSQEIGVNSNALATACNRLSIPYPSVGYWQKRRAGQVVDKPPLPHAPEARSKRLTVVAIRKAPAGVKKRRSRLQRKP